MLRFFFYFLLTVVISSCVSNKPAYDTVQNSSQLKQSERDIAYLKNNSKIEDNNYDFISTQMRTLIRNYKRMKKHLSNIEDKLDSTLKKLETYTYKSLLDLKDRKSLPQIEDEIRIINKEDEEIVLSINKLDDYKYIMGELIAGDYGTSEEETERALNLLKEKLEKAKLSQVESEGSEETHQLEKEETQLEKEETQKSSSVERELSGRETTEDEAGEEKAEELFDEDSLLEEEMTDEMNLFSQKQIKESEGDNFFFPSMFWAVKA